MAISGSDAKVTTGLRDSLLSSNVDASIFGATQSGPTQNSWIGLGGPTSVGSALAGVTPDMAKNIATGMESYRARIQGVLDGLNNVESTSAFRGTAVSTALTNFVEGVRKVSLDYLQKLVEAENEIVTSVASIYRQQDQDVSGQMNGDTDTLTSGGSSNSNVATGSNTI